MKAVIKKWWFWAIILVVIAGVTCGVIFSINSNAPKKLGSVIRINNVSFAAQSVEVEDVDDENCKVVVEITVRNESTTDIEKLPTEFSITTAAGKQNTSATLYLRDGSDVPTNISFGEIVIYAEATLTKRTESYKLVYKHGTADEVVIDLVSSN